MSGVRPTLVSVPAGGASSPTAAAPSLGRRNLSPVCTLVLGVVLGVMIQRASGPSETVPSCPPQNPCPACPSCPACPECAAAPPAAPVNIAKDSSILKTTAWKSLTRIDRGTAMQGIGEHYAWQVEYRKGPDSLLLFRHKGISSSKRPDHKEPGGLSECDELNLVIVSATRPGSCLLVSETSEKDGVLYFVERFCRGKGGDLCKPGSKGPLVPVARPSVYANGLPKQKVRDRGLGLLAGLMGSLPDISAELDKALQRVARADRSVTVMTTNWGDVELLLNWQCSVRARGIDISNTIVICSDEQSREAVQAAGIEAFHSPAFGAMPKDSARTYGDSTFGSMMWMKSITVWLTVRLGYDVLFQDADLVWFKDPWPYLKEKHANDDTVWMDDSARSERFGPYYANSGFYLVRNTPRGLQFAQEVLFQVDAVLSGSSHQAVVDSMLADGHSRYGLRVSILDPDLFSSGAYFHYRIAWVRDTLLGKADPYVFHMCWTSNKKEKLTFLKTLRWWWLKDECPSVTSKNCCKEPAGTMEEAWERYKKLRFKLDKKTVEQRMEQDKKSRRPFVPD
eukprot:Hpha_TRINITY_DN10647_c0_g3::TRINITY_DN10647_c0_g3_i1::g.156944::m.156944/K20892/RAY1; beta-arabinofuranosyltransferase